MVNNGYRIPSNRAFPGFRNYTRGRKGFPGEYRGGLIDPILSLPSHYQHLIDCRQSMLAELVGYAAVLECSWRDGSLKRVSRTRGGAMSPRWGRCSEMR